MKIFLLQTKPVAEHYLSVGRVPAFCAGIHVQVLFYLPIVILGALLPRAVLPKGEA